MHQVIINLLAFILKDASKDLVKAKCLTILILDDHRFETLLSENLLYVVISYVVIALKTTCFLSSSLS